MSNYESDVEAALASIKLEQSAEKQAKKLMNTQALVGFLNTHPEFKEFYNLVKSVEGF